MTNNAIYVSITDYIDPDTEEPGKPLEYKFGTIGETMEFMKKLESYIGSKYEGKVACKDVITRKKLEKKLNEGKLILASTIDQALRLR